MGAFFTHTSQWRAHFLFFKKGILQLFALAVGMTTTSKLIRIWLCFLCKFILIVFQSWKKKRRSGFVKSLAHTLICGTVLMNYLFYWCLLLSFFCFLLSFVPLQLIIKTDFKQLTLQLLHFAFMKQIFFRKISDGALFRKKGGDAWHATPFFNKVILFKMNTKITPLLKMRIISL